MAAGINLDIVHDGIGRPPISALLGVRFARFPYNVSNIHGGAGSTDLDRAKAVYRPYVEQLILNGITPVIVMGHQLYGEGAGYVWEDVYLNASTADRFIAQFADYCGRVAAQYADLGHSIIYEVWNEPDTNPKDARAAVPLQPRTFGKLFNAVYDAIRRVDTKAKIITGGYVEGAAVASAYHLNAGITRCDGIGVHPYGQGARANANYRPWGAIEDYLSIWRQRTQLPIYITEFGVLDNPSAPLARVISYAQDYIAAASRYNVKACIWYAWADGMDNGYGIVNRNGELKRTPETGRSILDVLKGQTAPPVEPPAPPPDIGEIQHAGDLVITPATILNVRNKPTTAGSSVIGQVRSGVTVTIYDARTQGNGYTWCPVQYKAGSASVSGWIAYKGGNWKTQVLKRVLVDL